ncbi:hypothetical protein CRG98_024704 [Punica granatum]|uniref:Uncharacterized protein n=1 Tax=Punica granatum TaxID=22663 RepID=A0A2I0JF63_PUNGR|nr:hypothetical protein CRG98_024704 [Punica granatum]
MTSDTFGRTSGTSCLSRDTPIPPRTPFLTELPGFAPLTRKRPLKTGLQAPRDHQGRGTSFRQSSGTRLGLPKYVSMVTNASRRAFGHFHGKQRPQRSLSTSQ